MEAKTAAILEAVNKIKAKGGSAIKIELEAQFNRDIEDNDEYCQHCDEGTTRCANQCDDGVLECDRCNGTGTMSVSDTEEADCEDCDATGNVNCDLECDDGYVTCDECNGDWESGSHDTDSWGNAERCLTYLLNKVGIQEISGDYCDHSGFEVSSPTSWLKYARFYDDGSVDSELTATVMLDDPQNVYKLVELVSAFESLGEAIGNEFDCEGAGMHMSILFSSNGVYPRNNSLNTTKLQNFRRSMKQLLPALYFLATPNGSTRSINDYRAPRVSVGFSDEFSPFDDSYMKYSAINYQGDAMEFRIFDTCYDKPEVVLDNVVVMANSLRFLSQNYISPGIDKKMRLFNFGNDNDRTLGRLYTEITHLDVLDIGLKHLKPSYYTIRELKKQRDFKVNRGILRRIDEVETKKAEQAYAEYCDRFEKSLIYREAQTKADRLYRLINDTPDAMRGKSREEIEALADKSVKEDVEALKKSRRSKTTYIKEQLMQLKEQRKGRIQIRFA